MNRRAYLTSVFVAVTSLIIGCIAFLTGLVPYQPFMALSIAFWLVSMLIGIYFSKSSAPDYVTWQAFVATILGMNGWIMTALIWIAFELGKLAGIVFKLIS